MRFKGDNQKIVDFVRSVTQNGYTKYIDMLKVFPVLAVIQKIISEEGLFQRLRAYYSAEYRNEEQLELFIKRYRKNLSHLMNLIQLNFDSMNTTLHSLYEWLVLQMRTNREENEPIIEGSDEAIEIITVHRAKGLQYHTVIILYTNHYFYFEKNRTEFLIEDYGEEYETEKRRVAWHINRRSGKNSREISSGYYGDLKKLEQKEIYKEKTRLLYVALTRAMERLVVFLPPEKLENTWSELIYETGIKVESYGH